ncbi:MAG: HAD family hydrolase [Nocardioidaceae bacterium]
MSRGPAVRAVLWDADGVLQRHGGDWRAAYAGLGLADGFLEELWAVEVPLMTGGDFPAAVADVARRHGVDAPVEDLLAPWRSIEPVAETLDVVGGVRAAGVRCYLATNQQEYRGTFMKQSLGYDDHLDGAFYSYELGYAKPDPAYFRAILDALCLDGAQVLFVDDRQANVDGAAEGGLRAECWHHDDGVDRLRAQLARHGLAG